MEVSSEDLKFKHPFTCIISGPTSSGKTVLMRRILENWKDLISIQTENIRVLWCYGQMQDLYSEPVQNVDLKYTRGKPSQQDIELFKPEIIILDDLMEELKSDKDAGQLFTKGSHHKKISVFFIVQNLFLQGNQMRTISLNTQYFILLKTPRGVQQIEHLSRQIFRGKTKKFLNIYAEATTKPLSYLLIDLHPLTNDFLRLRSRITKEELPVNVSQKYNFAPLIYDINS